MRVPRVLHILEATLGGTMRYLENVLWASANADIDAGFAYAVARADHQLMPMLEEAVRLGWVLFPIDMCREIAPHKDVVSCWQLIKVIRRFRPDILHCHSSKAGALGRVASLSCSPRPQVVYSPHALAGKRHHLLIEQTLKCMTSGFLAVSDSEREQILSYRLADPRNVEVLYPVVDVEYFQPYEASEARRQLQLPYGPIVAAVGRLTEQKNPLHFVQIIAELRRKVPDTLGIWVGDGALRRQFLAEVARLELADSVYLTGWQRDVRPYLAASDVVLSTSAFESFGYMVAEALSMQRPVVATRVCGTVDILQGRLAANLYPAGDTDEAVRLISALLADEDLALTLGNLGRALVQQRFSRYQMERKLAAYYQSLISGDMAFERAYNAVS